MDRSRLSNCQALKNEIQQANYNLLELDARCPAPCPQLQRYCRYGVPAASETLRLYSRAFPLAFADCMRRFEPANPLIEQLWKTNHDVCRKRASPFRVFPQVWTVNPEGVYAQPEGWG